MTENFAFSSGGTENLFSSDRTKFVYSPDNKKKFSFTSHRTDKFIRDEKLLISFLSRAAITIYTNIYISWI